MFQKNHVIIFNKVQHIAKQLAFDQSYGEVFQSSETFQNTNDLNNNFQIIL